MNKQEQFPQSIKEVTSNAGANINDWAAAMYEFNLRIAYQLDEERTLGSKNLEKFNLKRYKQFDLQVKDFLQNPYEITYLPESKIYCVAPKKINKELKRQWIAGLSKEGVLDFVNNFVIPEDTDDYEIAIEQMYPNIFGGTIVTDSKGNVYFEFIPGNQTAVSKGSAEIKYIVLRDTFTGSFKYSFTDENIRKLAFDAIMNVPHKWKWREMKFMTGYYEVVIAQRDEKSKPETFFVDYRDNDIYKINWDKIGRYDFSKI
jgi:hypothetical protein